MRIVKITAGVSCLAVALCLSGFVLDSFVWGSLWFKFVPAIIVLGMVAVGLVLILKSRSILSKKARALITVFMGVVVLSPALLDLQIRHERRALQARAKQFLARPAPASTRADSEGAVGTHYVGPFMDGLANSHALIERYATNGRIRWSAFIDGQFAVVSGEIMTCNDAAGTNEEARLYVADCRSLLTQINRAGFWQYIEDTIEMKKTVPEYEEEDRPRSDGRTPEEHRRIADAFLTMMHSSLTNETDIKPDDARLPDAIRELHPVMILMDTNGVNLMRTNKPENYWLHRDSNTSNTWVLTISGTDLPYTDFLRLEHD
jgi:hypothetical protein